MVLIAPSGGVTAVRNIRREESNVNDIIARAEDDSDDDHLYNSKMSAYEREQLENKRKLMRLTTVKDTQILVLDSDGTEGKLYRCSLHILDWKYFEIVMTCLIMCNCIQIGIETDNPAEKGTTLSIVYYSLEIFFTTVFCIEMIIKMCVYRGSFFFQVWNVIDFLIVISSVLDNFILVFFQTGDLGNWIRNFKMLRVLRMLRLTTTVDGLHTLMVGFTASLPSLFWVLTMVILCLYGFSVVMVIYVGNEAFLWQEKNLESEIKEWFGDIPKSMYTLFQVMTLESWSMGIVRPVMEVKPEMWFPFTIFLLLTTFAFLNMITGIVVDNTMKSSMDRKNRIEVTRNTIPRLMKILKAADKNEDGMMDETELESMFEENKELESQMDHLGFTRDEIRDLCRTFPRDQRNMISYAEFISSFLEINNSPSRKDILIFRSRMETRLNRLEWRLDAICDKLQVPYVDKLGTLTENSENGAKARKRESMIMAKFFWENGQVGGVPIPPTLTKQKSTARSAELPVEKTSNGKTGKVQPIQGEVVDSGTPDDKSENGGWM